MGNLQKLTVKERDPNIVYISTELSKSINKKENIITIRIITKYYQSDNHKFNKTFEINAVYSEQETLENILNALISHMNKQSAPMQLAISHFDECSFIAEYCDDNVTRYFDYKDIQSLGNNPITYYDKMRIEFEGLHVIVAPCYEHKTISPSITCKYMNKMNTNNPLKCPIYNSMKEQYQFNNENLNHLNRFIHFIDEYKEKPQCRHKDGCKSFIRLENGENRVDDKCHIKIYKHSPRNRSIKLTENIHAMIFNKQQEENHKLFSPRKDDEIKYNYNKSDGYLKALIEEVRNNGFQNDLCVECGQNDECKHDNYSILELVDEKINCHRHVIMGKPLNRAQMLALIMYTGCDCNYDLCGSQRKGDYDKWKWFDYCLCRAICALSERESGSFSVFTGLKEVKLSMKEVRDGFFVTYVSTSWRKQVSQTFIGGDGGMIIQFDKDFRDSAYANACDVSWISKFPDECEVLFARSVALCGNKFSCIVLDESNGIQTVSAVKNDVMVTMDGDRIDFHEDF